MIHCCSFLLPLCFLSLHLLQTKGAPTNLRATHKQPPKAHGTHVNFASSRTTAASYFSRGADCSRCLVQRRTWNCLRAVTQCLYTNDYNLIDSNSLFIRGQNESSQNVDNSNALPNFVTKKSARLIQRGSVIIRSPSSGRAPDVDSVYCVGFSSGFLWRAENYGACHINLGGKLQMGATGMGQLLFDEISRLGQPIAYAIPTVVRSASAHPFASSFRQLKPNTSVHRVAGEGAKVIIRSVRYLRTEIVRDAVLRLKRQEKWKKTFSENAAEYTIQKISHHEFSVVIPFKAEFVKNLP